MTDVPETTDARTVRVPETGAAGPGTPEAVVADLYRVLSGPAELQRERDWDAFRALVLPGARFLIARWPDESGAHVDALREWDVDGFIRDARRFYREDGFWEREIWGRTEQFGNVAHRFSSYESRIGSEDAEPIGRGVNSFQLVRFGDRWWIASIVWDVEGPDQPIPDAYTGGAGV